VSCTHCRPLYFKQVRGQQSVGKYDEKRLTVSERFNSGKLSQMDGVDSCRFRLMQVIAKTFQGLWLRGLCEPAFTVTLSICLLLFLSVICLIFDQVVIFFSENCFRVSSLEVCLP